MGLRKLGKKLGHSVSKQVLNGIEAKLFDETMLQAEVRLMFQVRGMIRTRQNTKSNELR